MRNLKVWQKLGVMAAVFVVPFAVVTYKMASSINVLGAQFAEQELRGLEYYAPLLVLLKDLQQHRGLEATWLNGDASFKERSDRKRIDVESDVKRVNVVDQRLDGALHTTQKWTALRGAVGELLDAGHRVSATQSFEQHTKVIENTIALIADVGDASNLTLDPDIDSYYVMNVLIFQGPELSEYLAQARGLGSAVAAARKGTAEQLETLNELAILMKFLQKKVDNSVGKARQANETLKGALAADSQNTIRAVKDATDQITHLVAQRGAATDAAEFFSSLTRSVESIFEVEERATGSLTTLLSNRVAKFHWEVAQALGWAALGLLVVSIIAVFIIRDITTALSDVVRSADQIALGNLDGSTASSSRKDEIGGLSRAFDQMIVGMQTMARVAERIASGDLAVAVKPRSERDIMSIALADMTDRLSQLLGDVHRSGIQVNTSVNDIAATTRQQQATASEIAATTSEIGATSKEISATSKELVKTMSEVSEVADQSAKLAGSGQVGVTRMEETMRHIMDAAGSINAKLVVLNEKAGNINQVVTTITKVADQTNLLSLNAAIEAEKAGEYGRGFAVVATEIRRLADQTAVATYDIEQMVKEIQSAVSAGVMGMDKFSEEVRRGMHDVQQVGNQLSEIIQQVQDLAPRFDAVNEGMQAQATGAEQITQALAQLSEAAQQTVESLRHSGRAIDGLNDAATGMHSGVSRFKLVA